MRLLQLDRQIRAAARRLKPVYVGGTVALTTSSAMSLTSLTGGIASAPAQNDIVIVGTAWGAYQPNVPNPGVTTSGYTQVASIASPYYSGPSQNYSMGLAVAWKKMGATPDTSVAVVASGSSNRPGLSVAHVWRNLDLTTPMDVAPTTDSGATSAGGPNSPAITPVTRHAWVLTIGALIDADSVSAATAPTGFGLLREGSYLTPGVDIMIGVAARNWQGGAVDPGRLGPSQNGAWAAVSLALRPSSA